ncbi:MAG: DEAD/DEAH box helicase [Sumerlaeia bacterium]
MKFESFNLHEDLLEGVRLKHYTVPTPIQAQAIPLAMKGRDVLGQSKTGTGKTAAFVLPILHQLYPKPESRFRVLILAPTRELAYQIFAEMNSFAEKTPFKGLLITGGNQDIENQEHALRIGGDFLIATPGRLQDHLRKRYLDFTQLKHVVFDEADQLLDMGFLPAIRSIMSHLPERRQTMMFSATLPQEIQQLASQLLIKPERIEADESSTPDGLTETVFPIASHQKGELLRELFKRHQVDSAIIFVRTKARADQLYQELLRGEMSCEALHADKTLTDRLATLNRFRASETRVLVATDLAARGLDIPQVSHVINVDLPDDPSDYLHRVGRASRAGRPGEAWTLMSASDVILVAKIEHFTRKRLKEQRLPDFVYEAEDPNTVDIRKGRKHQIANLDARSYKTGAVEKPFTKSGKVRRKFQVVSTDDELQKNKKKRVKIRKKLRHQR